MLLPVLATAPSYHTTQPTGRSGRDPVQGRVLHPAVSPAGPPDRLPRIEPVGVVEVGGEEWDDGEGTVGDALARQVGGEELGDLGASVTVGMGRILLWRCGGPSV